MDNYDIESYLRFKRNQIRAINNNPDYNLTLDEVQRKAEDVHNQVKKAEDEERAIELLKKLGLTYKNR